MSGSIISTIIAQFAESESHSHLRPARVLGYALLAGLVGGVIGIFGHVVLGSVAQAALLYVFVLRHVVARVVDDMFSDPPPAEKETEIDA